MLSTEEVMAVEILRGNLGAAQALADSLREKAEDGLITIPPSQRIKVDVNRIRVIAYINDEAVGTGDIDYDPVAFRTSVEEWLREGGALMCRFISRVELYEMPNGT